MNADSRPALGTDDPRTPISGTPAGTTTGASEPTTPASPGLPGSPDFPDSPDPGWKRRVALFLTAQTISLFGSNIVQYAIM